jgi:alpha-beta hydrolase superfamily lysophospholipase
MNREATPVYFSADGYRLAGVWHPAKPKGAPQVIGLHGLIADKASPKQIALARELGRHGIGYFRFDHRGCGESEGDFSGDTTLAARCRDLAAAVAALQRLAGVQQHQLGLFGSSFGGTVCLAFSGRQWKGPLATWAAPVRSRFLAPPLKTSKDGTTPPRLPHLEFDLAGTMGGSAPCLVLHGSADEVVPQEAAGEIVRARTGEKRMHLIEGCDHRITLPEHQQVLLRLVTDWFVRWLGRA